MARAGTKGLQVPNQGINKAQKPRKRVADHERAKGGRKHRSTRKREKADKHGKSQIRVVDDARGVHGAQHPFRECL